MEKFFNLVKKSIFKGKLTFDVTDDYTVIDFETTGLNPKSNEIIEIGAIRIRNGEIDDKFSTLVKPKKKLSPQITALTGITNDMLKYSPKIKDVFPKFIEFIGNDILVAHNAPFDISFLEKYIFGNLQNNFIDTLELSRLKNSDIYSHKLSSLAKYYNISSSQEHRALSDCYITYKLYERIKNRKAK